MSQSSKVIYELYANGKLSASALNRAIFRRKLIDIFDTRAECMMLDISHRSVSE